MENQEIQTSAKLAVLSDLKLCPTLYTSEIEIVKTKLSKRLTEVIKGCNQDEKQKTSDLIKASILKAIRANGSKKPDKEELKELAKDAYEALSSYKWLRVDEIPIIFKKGSLGDYGENFGVNAKTVNHWIRCYNETTKREAMKKQLEFEKKEAIKAEEERLEREAKQSAEILKNKLIEGYNSLLEQYREIKEEKEITWSQIPSEVNPHNVFWKQFYDNGLLDISQELKLDFWGKCKKETYENKDLLTTLKAFLKSEKEVAERLKITCENKYKDVIFRQKIADWIMNDVDLKELLEFNNL